MLAERAGVSAPTIRDIETGRFQLTEAVAQRIMLATGVSVQSLLKGENPLRNVLGEELSSESLPDIFVSAQQASMHDMLAAAIRAAQEKKRAAIFYNLFIEWLPQALAAIDATRTMKKVLNRNLGQGKFEPYLVPEAFQPTDAKMKKRWDEEQLKIWKAEGSLPG